MKSSEIARLLPEVYRAGLGKGTVLSALLEVMAQMHAPSERVLDHLDAFIDPRRTEDRFVPMLARWVDLGRLFIRSADDPAADSARDAISTGTGRLRELIARAAYLSQWRGTRTGLIAFLETATGRSGFGIEERVSGPDGPVRPFHIRIRVPPGLQGHRALIERIVEHEKPAYVTCDIVFPPNEG
jgi:phage tail-like protein